MNIKEEVIENKVVLVVIPNEDYNDFLINTIKKFLNNDKICHITLNKGYDALTIF